MPNDPADAALTDLLAGLAEAGYDFTAVTPATHQRVIARPAWEKARDLRGVFGWSLPFRSHILPAPLLDALRAAGALEERPDGLLRSRLRVASAMGRLFLHSAFPTDDEDAVFFGPDTYRFASLLAARLPALGRVGRMVEIGTGSGAGGILGALMLGAGTRIALGDVNEKALRLARANARHAGVEAEIVVSSGLEGVDGAMDLVIANPPYMIEEDGARAYRDGGDMHGAALALEWALEAGRRLSPGGRMLLYTGAAIVEGRDALREALERDLPPLGCGLDYAELDPDVFGEELERPAYRDVERIAVVAATIVKD